MMNAEYSSNAIKAIIGLGNPGQKYYKHRHSIGFRVLDELAQQLNASWQSSELMEYAAVRMNDHEVFLIKPTTFMNSSGKVMPWLQKKGIKPEQIVVVHDELEKPFGQVLIKMGGSHKGHNGLKSIMGAIGGDFWRLKFGIGRPDDKTQVPDYVLTNFSPQEEGGVQGLIERAIGLLRGS